MLVGMSALSDRTVHVFSSYLVCFEELTFLFMLFPKWLRDKQSTKQYTSSVGIFQLSTTQDLRYCVNELMQLSSAFSSLASLP